jgi:hypothetical protein
MMSRGARAERQAKLRLLESVRLETDEKRQQLDQKHAAMPTLSAVHAEEFLARIRAMSPDKIVELFQGYPLRMAGKNSFYYAYGDPRVTAHKDDPELAAAVEAVNLVLHAYDRARLNLRVTEFFGGRVSPEWSKSARIERAIFAMLVSAIKATSFYESLHGGDIRESENFKRVWLPLVRARAKRKEKEPSTDGDGAHGALLQASATVQA